MPNIVTHVLPVTEVRKGDATDGAEVTKVRTLDVNVELTLSNGKTRRIRKDTAVTVTRSEATREEKRAELVEMLDRSVARIKENAINIAFVGEATIRKQIMESTNLKYLLEWNVEEWLKELHMLDLFTYLAKWFEQGTVGGEPATDLEIVLAFMAGNDNELRRWTPGRSTSPVHNLSDAAAYLARHEIVDGLGRYEFAHVTYAVKKLAEFDAEVQ